MSALPAEKPDTEPEIRREIATAPVALPGTYYFDGRIHVRRFAPVTLFSLTCRNGHRMKVHGRPLLSTPQCEHVYRPGNQRCQAHIWIYKVSDRYFLGLDITREEADLIHSQRMSFDDVLVYFKLEMPRVT